MKFENSEDNDVWWYWSFTKMGAISLAQIMQNKFGCKILTKPEQNKDSVWEFSFTNPFSRDRS
jgi:hypothetical protein